MQAGLLSLSHWPARTLVQEGRPRRLIFNQKKNKNENGKWPTGSTGCNNDGGGSSSGVDNSDDNCSSSRRRIDDVVWW